MTWNERTREHPNNKRINVNSMVEKVATWRWFYSSFVYCHSRFSLTYNNSPTWSCYCSLCVCVLTRDMKRLHAYKYLHRLKRQNIPWLRSSEVQWQDCFCECVARGVGILVLFSFSALGYFHLCVLSSRLHPIITMKNLIEIPLFFFFFFVFFHFFAFEPKEKKKMKSSGWCTEIERALIKKHTQIWLNFISMMILAVLFPSHLPPLSSSPPNFSTGFFSLHTLRKAIYITNHACLSRLNFQKVLTTNEILIITNKVEWKKVKTTVMTNFWRCGGIGMKLIMKIFWAVVKKPIHFLTPCRKQLENDTWKLNFSLRYVAVI